MSFAVTKNVKFSDILQEVPQNECYDTEVPVPLLGGNLSDFQHIWHAKGPCLEVRNTKSGLKVGGWTFGCIIKDSNTEIVCVEELKSNGGLSLLVVALNCNIRGGVICLFNIFRSKVIRTIELKEKISSLCIIDPGLEVLNLPGPLRDFDGILSVGTEGGKVLLIDLCRQICEESISSSTLRDELNPSQLVIVVPRKISKLELYRERAIRDGDHLAIFLNVVVDSQTRHFTLKGPKGEDRIHVNSEEVATSALYYCNQMTSLLVGFNFGAFQLWNLTSLELVYTSHICEEHIPITKFALQEPTDDPKAFCYIWVAYSNTKLYQTGLPFAVMYSFCYESKEYHDGYGYLYENFQSCSVRFQVELGPLDERFGSPKGGYCLGLQPIYKQPTSKDSMQLPATGDTLALCVVFWSVWQTKNNVQNYAFIFDLNQWYKEQMPNFTKWGNSNNFILKLNLSDVVSFPSHCLSCLLDPLSLRQFVAVQRLEEHFYPISLTFDMWLLRENDAVLLHNEGVQKFLLNQIQTAGSLCLIRPNDICHKIFSLGLTPLFIDSTNNNCNSVDFQREVIFNVALEHHLISWLYNCATGWANGGFSSTGCSLDFLLNWAFQRAIVLKTNCDKYCAPLFDYSQSRLDHNTNLLLNSCTGQINILCKFYFYVITNLSEYVSCIDVAAEQRNSLEMVAVYFEVLQWLVNVGLLPESHPSSYPKPDISERISAPYPVQELTEYYVKKRAQLQLLSKERFASSDSLLFIDNLISYKCGAELLQKQWQDDEGSGLYPPPSLQSLLRTYLVPGANICHKHSLVIYLFLDLAMMLDQSQYSPVITYLIKFPAVFKVTSSIIKITQAFWQLDHGDYNTAIEQLLDPFVLNEDLQPWHHTIAMRSLLLQNQHNAALLYMEVRKPPILDDNEILTALSLYITNNMLSEAFYFLKGRCRDKEEKFLMHLFKECDKNESLHALLYKCLNNSEEKAFLKYLSIAQSPTSNDLQIFYFLLRSRFLEAFDMHTNLRKNKPECQGLIGQRNATQTDQIVKIFKTLLPDVNKNLVDYIRKERSNLWKEVPKPTPLSVFVHNTREQVHYKSTVIHAAISKAKDTFSDSMILSKYNIETEDTPFLRTPTAFKLAARQRTPIITPKVMELDENGEELTPSPPKRIKLSPRAPMTSPNLKKSSLHSKMLTPVVKRKTSLTQDYADKSSSLMMTPQSILKVRSFVMRNDTSMDETFNDQDFSKVRSSPIRNSSFGLLPRRSLSRPTQHVQFKDAALFSSSLSDQSTKLTDSNVDEQLRTQSLSSGELSLMVSKDSSTSHDDVFYSPDTSANENKTENVTKDVVVENNKENSVERQESENDIEMKDANKMEIVAEEQVVLSPRARRSYKRSYNEMTPTRSSPRLSRKLTGKESSQNLIEKQDSSEKSDTDSEEIKNKSKPPSDQFPRQRVKGRKPLSRQVLEHNTFSKMYESSPLDKTISKEISLKQSEKVVVWEESLNTSNVTTIESSLNVTDISTMGTPIISKQHTSSASFSKSRISEMTVGSDSSTLSDYNFSTDSIPDIKLPNDLLEYLKNASDTQQEQNENKEIESKSEKETADNTDEEISEMLIEEKITQEANTTKNEEIIKEINPLPEKGENESSVKDEEEPSDEKILSEVYEDLSSGSEDIAEVLNAAKQGHAPHSPERKMFPLINSKRETFYLPEAEVAFIADESKNDLSLDKSEKSVIVISSDDESSSKTSTSVNSNDSFSENESNDLNVSYEHNIHIEEHSISTGSESSRSTETSSGSLEEGIDQEGEIEEQAEEADPADWMNDGTDSSAGADVEIEEVIQVEEEQSEEEEQAEGNVQVEEEEEVNMQVEEDLQAEEDARAEGDELAEGVEIVELKEDEQPEENVQVKDFVELEGDKMENDPIIVEPDDAVKIEQENDEVEEKTYLNLQSHSSRMSPSSFLMEQPNYLQAIPLEDNELFEDTLINELSTVQEISENSNLNDAEKVPLEGDSEKLEETIAIDEKESKKQLVEEEQIHELTEEKESEINEPVIGTESKEISNLKDQSTNTTFVESIDTTKETMKKTVIPIVETPEEQNVTVDIEENKVKIVDNDDDIKEINIQKLEEDQNSSSSNTTEGGIIQEITVTAQIHTPSQETTAQISQDTKYSSSKVPASIDLPLTTQDNTLLSGVHTFYSVDSAPSETKTTKSRKTIRSEIIKKIDCNPLDSKETVENPIAEKLNRRTRSISVDNVKTYAQTSQDTKYSSDLSKVPTSMDLPLTTQDDTLLPGVRTFRSLSVDSAPSETKSIKTRKTIRSETIKENYCIPSDSKEIIEDPIMEKLNRRTRSNSVGNVKTYARKRSLRSSSVDEPFSFTENSQVKPVKPRTRALSISNLPVVKEEKAPKGRRRAASTLEDYASTRRLTRRQAGMLKGIPTPTDVTVEDDSDVEMKSTEDDFDPINLLDKKSFEGKPDPEETKVYEESSPSTSTVSSFVKPGRRLSRSASAASDNSLPVSQSSPIRKSTRKTKNEQETPKGVKTRSRKQSETSSIVSETSDSSTPPKRTRSWRGKSTEMDSPQSISPRTTRSRASSTKSDSPKSKSARRRIVSTKSDLPEIMEEKTSETAQQKENKSRKRKKT